MEEAGCVEEAGIEEAVSCSVLGWSEGARGTVITKENAFRFST